MSSAHLPPPALGIQPRLYRPEQCRDSPLQHRHVYDERRLEELAASIRADGYREEFPAVARPIPGVDPSKEVELVVGHRRRRAVEIAALRDIGITLEQQRTMAPKALERQVATVRRTAVFPVIVREMTDEEVVRLQATENFQKHAPHPLEEADCYAKYMRLSRAARATRTSASRP
jgi:ParB-like chromosome segregation protein Spo0J